MDNLDLVETVVLFPNKTSISAIFHPLHAPVVGASRQCSANVDLWTTRTFEEVNTFDPNDIEYQANPHCLVPRTSGCNSYSKRLLLTPPPTQPASLPPNSTTCQLNLTWVLRYAHHDTPACMAPITVYIQRHTSTWV